MVRPRRCRRVGWGPRFNFFGPRGVKTRVNGVVLTVGELESIRLSDYLSLAQKEAAGKMGISQPTFSRTLDEARKKVARALVEGSPIRIAGGNYQVLRQFNCFDCGNIWDESYGTGMVENCPTCGSVNIRRGK